ncbi:transposase [Streptomyces sp. S186]|uniref:transposase n=1 Tax=Streptomyces sp. S186 TaxID=3434395 RepID=UPI003F66FE22
MRRRPTTKSRLRRGRSAARRRRLLPSAPGVHRSPDQRRHRYPAPHADRRQSQRCHPAQSAVRSRSAGAGKRGRPRRRPDIVLGDRGYDHDKYRRLACDLGVKPLVVRRRGIPRGSSLGTQRCVVERAFAHLHCARRLRIRWEIRDDTHEAFLTVGCAVICWRRLNNPPLVTPTRQRLSTARPSVLRP